jgi:PAS domain S-box-containing protein
MINLTQSFPTTPKLRDGVFTRKAEAFRASESRYRRLFETAQDGILLLNAATGQIEDVNPFLIKMLGYTHDELIGKKLWEIGAFSDDEQCRGMFLALQTRGYVRYEDLPLVSKAGKIHEVEFVSNSYDCDGVKVIQCNIRDITDRIELQREAAVREARYKAVSTTALDAFITSDASGRIIGWNPSAERIFGYTTEEVMGQALTLLMPQRFHELHLEGMARMRANGERRMIGKTVELIGRRKSGDEFPIELSTTTWADGKKRYFTGIVRDITDRKASDLNIKIKGKALAESNQELERFAYVASHDLREPLRMINSFLTLLERRNPQLDSESKEFLEFAKDGAVRMDRMVLDLLDLSRVGRSGAAQDRINVSTSVAEAIANLQFLIEETKSDIAVVDPLPIVLGCQDELTRLFQNLISNAIKYRHTDRHPVIRITCEQVEDAWQFSVADNGIGIASEYHDRIFIIFQRLHGRETYEGTGIGLAICKKIVSTFGGKIWVESGLSKGSTFYFTIPKEKVPS